jgi:hypothetical protein
MRKIQAATPDEGALQASFLEIRMGNQMEKLALLKSPP